MMVLNVMLKNMIINKLEIANLENLVLSYISVSTDNKFIYIN